MWDGMPAEQREGFFKQAADSLLVKHVALPNEVRLHPKP